VRRSIRYIVAGLALGVPALTAGCAQATPSASAQPISRPAATASTAQDATSEPIGGPRMAETGLVLDLPTGVPAPPAFPASCYLVADLDSGAVILAKCPHAKGLPASTIKALTALALVDELPPATVITATEEDANQEGSRVGIRAGSSYTVEQLFQGMLLTSGNDAAWALARHRGLPETIAAMNAKAAQLGARDTAARNPSGLDATDQVSSAYDMALIGRAVLRNERLAGYVKTERTTFPSARVPGGGTRGSLEITNHNRLLTRYSGTIGVKNGYTLAARRTYIGAARRGASGYLLTYLKNPSSDWRLTTALFDWAFAYGGQVRPVGQLVEPAPGDPGAHSAAQGGSGQAALEALSAEGALHPAGAGVGAPQLDGLGWFGAHPEALLFTAGSMTVIAAGVSITRRTRQPQ
jgi:serine-type D-Ala-D-Ala carboxypeptidase (penicillin-binding protein 5/6)